MNITKENFQSYRDQQVMAEDGGKVRLVGWDDKCNLPVVSDDLGYYSMEATTIDHDSEFMDWADGRAIENIRVDYIVYQSIQDGVATGIARDGSTVKTTLGKDWRTSMKYWSCK